MPTRKPKATKKPAEARAPEASVPLAVVGRGRRRTQDTAGRLGFFGAMTIIPPKDPSSDWRSLNLDSKTLSRISASELAEYLVDLSPEVSAALFDFLRECNPGYELKAYRPGTETVDQVAQAALQAFINTLDNRQDGIFDVSIGRLFMGMFLRGAFLAELVLDEQGRMPIELVTPDPWGFRWRKAPDPVLGTRNVLCQWQAGKLVDLDFPTVRYVPIDPLPGSPYGRPLVNPALFVCLFLLAVMHDLRRVIQNQGYPRNWIQISLEEIIKAAPQLASSWQALNAEAQKAVSAVETYLPSLEPDDTFVTTSMVNFKEPIGAGGSGSLEGISATIDWLERMAVRALKTTPFQMAMSQSQTETQANRQFESRMLGIRTIQHYAETPLSRLFTLALQAQGIIADVKMRFNVNRASERQRDAQTESVEIANEEAKVRNRWQTNDEASQTVTGSPAVDPDYVPSSGPAVAPNAASQENPDPSASRSVADHAWLGIRSDANGRGACSVGCFFTKDEHPSATRAPRDRKAKLIPLGAEDGFEPLGDLEPLTEDERAALSGVFDRSMTGTNGQYKGLLESTVIGEDDE